MKIGIIIPARYGSKRLEGKPLRMIGNQTMLQRVVEAARAGAGEHPVIVATDHPLIYEHARSIGVEVVLTDENCATGTDRVYQAATRLPYTLDFVINLQGDSPFTPPQLIREMIGAIDPTVEMVTPAIRLSWDALEVLRKHKESSPSSGTTVVVDKTGHALWFSKQILPYVRNKEATCPVLKHVGVYGYSLSFLERFISWPEGVYEKIEGLEQLRALENGAKIKVHLVSLEGEWMLGGIDTEEDLKKACTIVTEKQK